MDFEIIKPWDGVSDTGKDARLKIERNFKKVGDKVDLIEQDVTTEQQSRASADQNLQSQIDTVNATQNVVDIVGTKAELTAYITTNLKVNDKIEVLVDESQSSANTIYSWDLTTWVLIGNKAAYYSKSETDQKDLALQQQFAAKADLVEGKVPVGQVPLIAPGMITSKSVPLEDSSWGNIIGEEGNWYIKDKYGLDRPHGLPSPAEGELFTYSACCRCKQEGHMTTILTNVDTMDTYIIEIANGAYGDSWWAKKLVFEDSLEGKADLVEGKVPVEQVPLIAPGMITSKSVPLEDSSWGNIIGEEGNWYIKDKYGLDRPHGLPSPAEGELFTYSACCRCKQEGHMTTILTNVDTMDTYIIEIANGAYGDSWWAKKLVFEDSLEGKADLVEGKVPVEQVPLIAPGMITSKSVPLEDSSWGNIIGEEGNWYIKDKYGLDRPHGLPSPAEGELFTYSACCRCKQEGHMTTILTNVDTMDTYIIEIANGAYGDSWWAKKLVFEDSLEGKADLVEGKVPVEQVPLIAPGMITSKSVPLEDSSWGNIIGEEGNWYIKDKYGLDRPHGLPSPAKGELFTYSACCRCKQEGHMTTILTNVDTMDTYIIEIANGAYGDSWWAKKLVFADELGNIDDILDILNGDLVGDVQEVLDNMIGV